MKGAVIAVFALTLALAAATECEEPDHPVGTCPVINGEKSVYLMDEVYRGIFYECDWGRPIRQSCPSGLVFDPRLKVCNYPSSETEEYGPVGKCPSTDEKSVKFLRDGANISVFYICVDGEPLKYVCDEDLIFNPIIKACFAPA